MSRTESLHARAGNPPLLEAAPSIRPGSGLAGYRKVGRILMLLDGAGVAAAFGISYLVRFGSQPLDIGYVLLAAIAPLAWVMIMSGFGLYALQRLSPIEEFRRVLSAVSIGMVFVVMTSFWAYAAISRIWVALTWILSLTAILGARKLVRVRVASRRSAGTLALRALVIGRGAETERLEGELRSTETGFQPVGVVEVGERRRSQRGRSETPAITVDSLVDTITQSGADCLFVASSSIGDDLMMQVVRAARRCEIEVYVSAHLPEILTGRLTPQPLGRVMTLALTPVRLTGIQATSKRLFDIVVATGILLLTAPLALACAVCVGLSSSGTVLYRQERVTKGGRIFDMLKFRTMFDDGDRILAELGLDASAPFFKLAEDPRVTRVGRFLRRTSLDELPQLINVLRGEMSLVGPRPLPVEQVLANTESLGPRHEVPAGMTGWWQIRGRSSVSPREALRMDLFYIENWSLALDVYILVKTVGAVAFRRGAA